MRAIVFAYNDMGCSGLRALIDQGFEIVAVFTHRDDASEAPSFASVAEQAAKFDVPVYAPVDVNHPLWVERIRDMAPDIIFSFYYRNLICQAILDIPPSGCLNLHGSLLPAFRGRAPANWVLIKGESRTGVTLHHMIDRPDAGDIVSQRECSISPDDSGHTINRKLAVVAEEMLADVLPLISAGTAPRIPQDESQASYFGRRTPADGIIRWDQSATAIVNLVRAVTRPYPGAFTYATKEKLLVWGATVGASRAPEPVPGTVLSIDPLTIACGEGCLEVTFGQSESGVFCSGTQLAAEAGLVVGAVLGADSDRRRSPQRKTRVLILGVNGFIGNALSERLIEDGNYEVHGMDLNDHAIKRLESSPDFHFHEGDISIHSEWIEYHIKKCDVILPLVAIATPIEYVRNPLRVFELDFEENLRIVRYCVKYNKRIVFPSTSEVYGMSDDQEFDEDKSRLILGPINKQRWIYSCSKQLLDRVIWAYGESQGLKFTLFRPFNWIGPRLDSLHSARVGSSRAITQLILNLVEGAPLLMIDGGLQKRCFTDVNDGIECLFRIIENPNDACNSQIINIGNPQNEASIKELAEILVEEFERHPFRDQFPPTAGLRALESSTYYGKGYEDVEHRRPRIENAKRLLDWHPAVPLREAVTNTLNFFIRDYLQQPDAGQMPAEKAKVLSVV